MVAALALFAGPAHAAPRWHMHRSPADCEQERSEMQANGSNVSPACEFRPKGDMHGNDTWLFWIY
ncbi:hypothetical protein GCM10011588_40650 [Nocardia jinanensis]|uniref:Uncharacterized protein n=1 Tax=Nocardia jinanensis TaxID=382504 RepID=A0A917VWJ6_9NOCA|nr:hypothetical protein GCM10011588_40650 [Nocardia jinanensis]